MECAYLPIHFFQVVQDQELVHKDPQESAEDKHGKDLVVYMHFILYFFSRLKNTYLLKVQIFICLVNL